MGKRKRIKTHAWANVDLSMNVAEVVENDDLQWEDRSCDMYSQECNVFGDGTPRKRVVGGARAA